VLLTILDEQKPFSRHVSPHIFKVGRSSNDVADSWYWLVFFRLPLDDDNFFLRLVVAFKSPYLIVIWFGNRFEQINVLLVNQLPVAQIKLYRESNAFVVHV